MSAGRTFEDAASERTVLANLATGTFSERRGGDMDEHRKRVTGRPIDNTLPLISTSPPHTHHLSLCLFGCYVGTEGDEHGAGDVDHLFLGREEQRGGEDALHHLCVHALVQTTVSEFVERRKRRRDDESERENETRHRVTQSPRQRQTHPSLSTICRMASGMES